MQPCPPDCCGRPYRDHANLVLSASSACVGAAPSQHDLPGADASLRATQHWLHMSVEGLRGPQPQSQLTQAITASNG